MKHHSELINFIIKQKDLKSYIEIGTFNRSHNFDLIECKMKYCVDPDPNARADFMMTSDVFFEFLDDTELHGKKFDCYLIDGLHHAEQVKKDFENALRCLTDKGYIIIHDANPHSESITHEPRDSREWCGSVYKFVSTLGSYDGIDFLTVDMDYGCCVVWKDKKTLGYNIPEITWDYFVKNKQKLLRLVDVEMFKMLMGNRITIIKEEYIDIDLNRIVE